VFAAAPAADGGADPVAGGTNAEVDTGLLLKRMLALVPGEPVGTVTGVVLAGGAEFVAGAAGLMAGAFADG
jgi:hypothetical protein